MSATKGKANQIDVDNFDSMDAIDMSTGEGDFSEDSFIDLSGVNENQTFEATPAGIYNARVDNVEFGHSQSKGNPMLTWTLKYTNQEGRERTAYYHTVLTGESLPRLKRTLVRLLPHSNQPDFDLAKFRPGDAAEIFIGTPCRVRLKI